MSSYIKTIWLPGAASCVFLFGLYFLHSLLPAYTKFISPEQRNSFITLPYLAVMPFAGALGAFLSRWMKGSVGQRILSALFPIFTFALLFVVRIVFGLFFERAPYTLAHFMSGVTVLMIFMTVGGLSLALGALPFCRNGRFRPSDSTPQKS